jgi:hypothetical protein
VQRAQCCDAGAAKFGQVHVLSGQTASRSRKRDSVWIYSMYISVGSGQKSNIYVSYIHTSTNPQLPKERRFPAKNHLFRIYPLSRTISLLVSIGTHQELRYCATRNALNIACREQPASTQAPLDAVFTNSTITRR